MVAPPKKRQKRNEHQDGEMPQKKFFRQRAHANPFSDHDLTYPESPDAMDWSQHYPAFVENPISNHDNSEQATQGIARLSKQVEIADIGCGYGGLLFALSPRFPDSLILGLEIRTSVTAFVQNKITALRHQNQNQNQSSPTEETPHYNNIACLRANTMKFLPNFFHRAQLSKIFLCFPDPHFKARKHKARIVNASLISEYAFVLQTGGRVYMITDVLDLYQWMTGFFERHESFERLAEGEVEEDECVGLMTRETEEGKKVERNEGRKFVAVFRRLEDPGWP